MIEGLRTRFNQQFSQSRYSDLLTQLQRECESEIAFRVAETPVFLPYSMLLRMAREGEEITRRLLADKTYLDAAAEAIPRGFRVANLSLHPHFLTADFALIRKGADVLEPRLVEIQAFPSVFAFQALLCKAYRQAFQLTSELRCFFGELNEESYWELLRQTILGEHEPESIVLTEVDPYHQKTLPDFLVTSRKLGIPLVDIAKLEHAGDRLFYKNNDGQRVQIKRIYNRAIADELLRREIRLPFDLEHPWNVEWAGHPNWYFLISKLSLPWLSRGGSAHPVVPPAVFLDDFLRGNGARELESAGVPMAPSPDGSYAELLLKPLFSFAGKGIEFAPTMSRLEAIPPNERSGYLLQQRMNFEPTIATPFGLTQAEVRILYVWPDNGQLTPVLSLVRLGRGKMMGVDHNRNRLWVGASAAFYPAEEVEHEEVRRG